jgi:hypothetical protein
VAKRRVHRVPHAEIKTILWKHGVRSVNQAVAWGETAGAVVFPPDHPREGERRYPLISAKSVEGIVRGKRVLGVEFDRVDQILCALDAPDHWYKELARWYYPPAPIHEPDYETFLSQTAAFDRACEMLQGVDSALSFR